MTDAAKLRFRTIQGGGEDRNEMIKVIEVEQANDESLSALSQSGAVDEHLLLFVEQYALETCTPIKECIDEAISDWREIRAEPRLESLRALQSADIPSYARPQRVR